MLNNLTGVADQASGIAALQAPPEHVERKQRRAAYRISVTQRALVEWQDPEPPYALIRKPGVITNLSGSGAHVFLRHLSVPSTPASCSRKHRPKISAA